MNNNPLAILNRFPGKQHLIIQRMTEDMEFYALCQDYEICVKALNHWSASSESNAKARVDEYRMLVRELELEITDVLNASTLQQQD